MVEGNKELEINLKVIMSQYNNGRYRAYAWLIINLIFHY
jgi:hypothetical protein